MRLDKVDNGHGPAARLQLALMGLVMGADAPDVVKASLYRPELFGRPFHRLLQQVMRGPSPWTPGERELFAAFTSRRNACRF